MNYDLYASYLCRSDDDVRKIVGDHCQAPHRELQSIYARIQLLSLSIVERCREYAKSGHYKYGGGYKSLLHTRQADSPYTKELIRPALENLREMGIYPPSVEISSLPRGTTFIQFPFVLAKPYMSRGTEELYIHENPIVKEATFKVPMVQSSSWKGIMRKVVRIAIQDRGLPEETLDDLFGNEGDLSENYENAKQGELFFYPTFFDKIDLDVINPHGRKTRSGKNPILIEMAPPGAAGVFSLLYCPFSLIEASDSELNERLSQILPLLATSIREMMTDYGFSAKRTKGYGAVRDELSGCGLEGGFVVISKIMEDEQRGKFRSLRGFESLVNNIVKGS
ncbi:MAG: RAMP superfamily CRISPR-associated protein [bacterium]